MSISQIEKLGLRPTEVYSGYWEFAVKRQDVFNARMRRSNAPVSSGDTLSKYRFTNTYRVLDRVSQYLVSEVQRPDGVQLSKDDVLLRTLLFKVFNKIETWVELEKEFGHINLKSFDKLALASVLDKVRANGNSVYSGAYIMPSPKFGFDRKHKNHLALLEEISTSSSWELLMESSTLSQLYKNLLDVPSFGHFLAFQFAIDLSYSDEFALSEEGFVVAGPGAIDGISKCFQGTNGLSPERIIMAVCEDQNVEFRRRDLFLDGIPGRPLQPIDCQNLFCEISKYARVEFPDHLGSNGRTRIKQMYRPSRNSEYQVRLPDHWEISPVEFADWLRAPPTDLLRKQ